MPSISGRWLWVIKTRWGDRSLRSHCLRHPLCSIIQCPLHQHSSCHLSSFPNIFVPNTSTQHIRCSFPGCPALLCTGVGSPTSTTSSSPLPPSPYPSLLPSSSSFHLIASLTAVVTFSSYSCRAILPLWFWFASLTLLRTFSRIRRPLATSPECSLFLLNALYVKNSHTR